MSHRGLLGFREDEEEEETEARSTVSPGSTLLGTGSWKTADKDESLILSVVSRSPVAPIPPPPFRIGEFVRLFTMWDEQARERRVR